MVTGQTKASSMPVTTALRSPMVWSFFRSLRYSHSQKIQAATETAVTTRARKPNTITAATSAGIMAITTSSIRDRVVSLERMWGEEVTIHFKFL